MGKILVWTIWLAMVIAGLWELGQGEPHLPLPVTGLLLVGITGLAGLRIGTDYATTFVRDTIRTNKFLTQQNQELIDLNRHYMKSLSTKTDEPAEAQQKTVQRP